MSGAETVPLWPLAVLAAAVLALLASAWLLGLIILDRLGRRDADQAQADYELEIAQMKAVAAHAVIIEASRLRSAGELHAGQSIEILATIPGTSIEILAVGDVARGGSVVSIHTVAYDGTNASVG